jgi:hypothetical protein
LKIKKIILGLLILAYLIGSGLTSFGNHAGLNTLDLMSMAAQSAFR